MQLKSLLQKAVKKIPIAIITAVTTANLSLPANLNKLKTECESTLFFYLSNHQFCNLHRIGSCALAQLIAAAPQIQTVGIGQILT